MSTVSTGAVAEENNINSHIKDRTSTTNTMVISSPFPDGKKAKTTSTATPSPSTKPTDGIFGPTKGICRGPLDVYFMSRRTKRENDITFVKQHALLTEPVGIKHAACQASTFLKQMQDASAINDFSAAGKE